MNGICELPHESGGDKYGEVEVIMNDNWTMVQYFHAIERFVDLNALGINIYTEEFESAVSGHSIPFAQYDYYEVAGEEFIVLTYRLIGSSVFSSIYFAGFFSDIAREGEVIRSETSLEKIVSNSDDVEIKVVMKKIQVPDENKPQLRPSDKYTQLTGSIGSSLDEATILAVKGVVDHTREGEDQSGQLQVGSTIKPGDRLKTDENSNVQIKVPKGGKRITAADFSKILFDNLSEDEEIIIFWFLYLSGEYDKMFTPVENYTREVYSTPYSSSYHYGTVFYVKYDSLNLTTEVITTDGNVLVTNQGFDSTDVAGIHFELDSVEVPAWKKVTIVDHDIGDLEDYTFSKIEIKPDVVSISPHDLAFFAPYAIGDDGNDVQILADWESIDGGEVYENSIFVSNGEFGVFPISCHEPNSGLVASAIVRVDFPYPDTTQNLYVANDPVVMPGDTLWLHLFLGSELNELEGANLLHFDLDILNPEYLHLFDPEANSFLISDWTGAVFDLDYDYLEDKQKFTFDLTQNNENALLDGSGKLMRIGFVTDINTPALQEIDFELSNVILRDTSDYQFEMVTNTSQSVVAERVGTPEIMADEYLFSNTLEVLISAPDGASVYYTLDGTAPTEDDALYDQAMVFDTSQLMKARAFKDGFIPSFPVEASFIKVYRPEATEIIAQPESVTLCEGGMVKFSVEATGTNLQYQWAKDEVSIGGAITNTFIIPSVEEADMGAYACMVSGELGEETSEPALLEVYTRVEISTEPEAVDLKIGEETVFEVQAKGSGLNFQWYKEGNMLEDDGRIVGAQTNQLKIQNVSFEDEGLYSCLVKGECNEENTEPVALSINTQISALNLLGFSIQPNPVHDYLVIDTGTQKIESIEIMDGFGKVILAIEPGDFARLNLKDLTAGKYLLRIIVDDKAGIAEFIKL